jgi:hypothetical protein
MNASEIRLLAEIRAHYVMCSSPSLYLDPDGVIS